MHTRRNCTGSSTSIHRRPTATTKLVADCVLNDLRLRLLRAELTAAGPAAALLTTLRHRVDMCRRVLAMHMTRDDSSALPIVGFL